MRRIKLVSLLALVILTAFVLPSCSKPSPSEIDEYLSSGSGDYEVWFWLYDAGGKSLKVPGSVKITVTGNSYRIREQLSSSEGSITQTRHAENVPDFKYALDLEPFVYQKEFTLTEDDFTQFRKPGYTYTTITDIENAKRGINTDPWGYQASIAVTDIAPPIYLEYASKYADYPSLVADLTGTSLIDVQRVDIVVTTANGKTVKGSFEKE